MHKRSLWGTLALWVAISLAAQAEPQPTPVKPPAPELHLSLAAPGSTLVERVKASGPQVVAPAPAVPATPPQRSIAESVQLQFRFFYFGPVLGAGFRL